MKFIQIAVAVLVQGAGFAQTTAVTPHFACGGGWSTTVMFTNGLWYPMSSVSNPWRLHFTLDVRSPDNTRIATSYESLANESGTFTKTFTCNTDAILMGRIDWIFHDAELKTFNQPQKKLKPMAIFTYNRDGVYMEAGMPAQFLAGVDTIVGEDAQGNSKWLKITPSVVGTPIVMAGGFKYGIALSNPNNVYSRMRVLFTTAENQIASQRYFYMKPKETITWIVYEVPDDFVGSARVYNDEGTGAIPVGLAIFRFSPFGQFTSAFPGY